MLGAYVLAIRSDRRLRRYHLFGRWWRAEWQRFRDVVRIGTPIALIILAEGGLFSSAAFLMGRIGQAELAGHTVALQVAALAFQIPFGIGQAATIRVGYHFGAGDRAAIGGAGKAALILAAAIAVAMQIGWRLANPAVPLFEGMGIAALLNLGANFVCLRLLTPYRHGDVNMASAWECSRNDMLEGAAVIAAALGVWAFDAGWPDLAVAAALLLLFVRSAWRVVRAAWRAHSLGRH